MTGHNASGLLTNSPLNTSRVAIALVTLLFLLSAVHWYWLFGGKSGRTVVVPTLDGTPAFRPGMLATAAVASLLLLAGLVCAAQSSLFGLQSTRGSYLGVAIVGVLFALRAVGEFRLVGIFKRVHGTRFSRLDNWIFTPVCVVVAALCALLLYATEWRSRLGG